MPANRIPLSNLKQYIERDKDYIEVQKELENLLCVYQNNDNPKLFEYVPVKIVACFQEFFRDKYKVLINDPSNRDKLKEVKAFANVKIDLDVIGAFQESEVSMGDYLSYIIPCSKIEDIDNALTPLLGFKFLDKLREKYDANDMLNTISRIFKLRHMYCHEVPYAEELNHETIILMINRAHDFLSMAGMTILGNNDACLTNGDMIEMANTSFEIAETKLDDLINKIKHLTPEEGNIVSLNLDYIESWKKYRDDKAKAAASIVEGGSMYPLLYLSSKESTTKALISELKEEYKYELRR